jgi:SulP family sulfate permease
LPGLFAGGLTARTRLMIITTTSVVALAAGPALHNLEAPRRPAAMALLADRHRPGPVRGWRWG